MRMVIKDKFNNIRRAITLYGDLEDGSYHLGHWKYTPAMKTIAHEEAGDDWSATVRDGVVILKGIEESTFMKWVECGAVPVLTLLHDGEEAISEFIKENTKFAQRILTTVTQHGSLVVWSTDWHDVVHARIFGENEFVYDVMEEGVTAHIVEMFQSNISPLYI